MTKDKTKPLFHWFVDCRYGKELVLALYTRPCRYGRCAFCALPTMSEGGEQVSAKDIEQQVDYILSHYNEEHIAQIGKVSIYTASSSLDQECLPTRSLMYLILKISNFPKLQIISLETRPEYVEEWELKTIKNVLGNHIMLEVGIGYETHNPVLRNQVLHKGLSVEKLHELCKMLGENAAALKAYLMLKPHFSLTEEQGIQEAINGLDEISKLGKTYKVDVSVHLNPTYIAKGCRLTNELIENNYLPPELSSIITVIEHASKIKLPIYVGLDDEGIAIEGGTYRNTGLNRTKTVNALLEFNQHQNYQQLIKSIN